MTTHYDIDWLIETLENGTTLKFIYFWGHTGNHGESVGKFCFSQWFESPFTVDGVTYKTSEHWMMAQKALLFGDMNNFDSIIHCHKPGEAKELGRRVLGYDEKIWDSREFDIVKNGNIHKFNQNKVIADFLIKTESRILVEASPLDSIWGVGLSQDNERINNVYEWKGLNLLGFALMETRDFLKEIGHFNSIENALLPPWKKFLNADYQDIFWKTSQGADYLQKFRNYYLNLNNRDKIVYKLTNPSPYTWQDFYNVN